MKLSAQKGFSIISYVMALTAMIGVSMATQTMMAKESGQQQRNQIGVIKLDDQFNLIENAILECVRKTRLKNKVSNGINDYPIADTWLDIDDVTCPGTGFTSIWAGQQKKPTALNDFNKWQYRKISHAVALSITAKYDNAQSQEVIQKLYLKQRLARGENNLDPEDENNSIFINENISELSGCSVPDTPGIILLTKFGDPSCSVI